jgi:hypothetical protein
MTDDPKKPLELSEDDGSSDEQPEIYGIKQGAGGIVLNRRSFLGAIAASGVLTACDSAAAAQGKDTPPVLPKAHEGRIDGIFIKDKMLFSWDTSTLKAWEFTKGTLKNKVTKGFKDPDIPNLFKHLWDAPLTAIGPGGLILAMNRPSIPNRPTLRTSDNKTITLKEAKQPVRALAFAPDGKLFAAGGGDGSIRLWNTEDGSLQQSIETNSVSSVLSLAFHPNGTMLLSGHHDGTVRMWQLPEGEAKQTLPDGSSDHSSASNLEITPNGALAVAANDTIKLWALPEGKMQGSPLSLPIKSEGVSAMDITEDSQLLATGTTQGHIYLWRLEDGAMLGYLFDPDLTPKDTQMALYRQMGKTVCACDTIAMPAGFVYRQMGRTVCTCDTIAVPAGSVIAGGCVCDTVAIGNVPRLGGDPARGGGGGGSHYWRPN